MSPAQAYAEVDAILARIAAEGTPDLAEAATNARLALPLLCQRIPFPVQDALNGLGYSLRNLESVLQQVTR